MSSSLCWGGATFHFIKFRLFQEQLFAVEMGAVACAVGISYVNLYKQNLHSGNQVNPSKRGPWWWRESEYRLLADYRHVPITSSGYNIPR